MIFNGGLITLPPVPLRDGDLRLQSSASEVKLSP